MKIYHKVIPAVYLLIINENKILLQRRFNTGYQDGNYTLVCGHIDTKERATKAALREAEEEIGIKIKEKDLVFYHLMHRKSGDQERMDLFFFVKKWSGQPKNLEPEKCDDLTWFEKKNLPTNIIPCVQVGIEAYFNKVNYSELSWPD